MTAAAQLPRTIWLLWLQGLDQAPELVRRCHASWVRRNPGWRVVLLDQESYGQYAPAVPAIAARMGSRLSPASQSDLIRLELLVRHGGVWADATTFCRRPLDEWLIDRLGSGFFAYAAPGQDRPISSWFLAAVPGNEMVQEMWSAAQRYFTSDFRGGPRHWLSRLIRNAISGFGLSTDLWFSPFMRRVARVYPYFWFHYLFGWLLRRNAAFAARWRESASLPAGPPHRVQRAGMLADCPPDLQEEIRLGREPVYKLNWRYDARAFRPGCTLDQLFSTLPPPNVPDALP